MMALVIFVITVAVTVGVCRYVVEHRASEQSAVVTLAAIAGGLLGFADLHWTGAVAGAIFGAVAAGLVGAMVLGLVDVFFRFGKGPGDGEVHPEIQPPYVEAISRLAAIVFLAVMSHEAFWLVNVAAAFSNYNVGATITQYTYRDDSRAGLRQALRDRQWEVKVFTARPLRWCLSCEGAVENSRVAELSDYLCDKSNHSDMDKSLKSKLGRWLFKSDSRIA